MSVPVVALFDNKGGVEKTTIVYNLAWMYSDMGVKVLAADLDPQANLTAAFLDEGHIAEYWDEGCFATVHDALAPLFKGAGDIGEPHCEEIAEDLALLPGDLSLTLFEDAFSESWMKALDGDARAFQVLSAFWRLVQSAAREVRANVILIDLGPNLGSISRAALIAADYVVIPVAPDLFSLHGLKNLGPSMRSWRIEWRRRREANPDQVSPMPPGGIEPVGYVVWQHGIRLDRPARAYDRWMARIPSVYASAVLNDPSPPPADVMHDPNCLGLLRQYHSLMPMAQEARKPMFHLQVADGALGAHVKAVEQARNDFEGLANRIAERSWSRMTAATGSAPERSPSGRKNA